MRFYCLACDYDGTLAKDSVVSATTLAALKRVKESGRKLILVTGREIEDLRRVFSELPLFDRVVAENGAVLYHPARQEERVLAEPPPKAFVDELRRRGVHASVGRSIVATWHPYEEVVLQVIREMGLELHVIFNKNAVMVLPSGVTKASGLQVALSELKLSAHNVVAVGDAENDHALLSMSECGVAVANALLTLKERADWVTSDSHGLGVEQLVQQLVQNDLCEIASHAKRHLILLGRDQADEELCLNPADSRLLITGPSGGGKSNIVAALIERLIEAKYQVCTVDPEGDYDEFEGIVTLGGPDRIPSGNEIVEVLNDPMTSLSINLLGVSIPDRPQYFLGLLPQLQELRGRTGRPHWLVIDEATHLLPTALDSAAQSIPKDLGSFLLIAVHPSHVNPAILRSVNGVLLLGDDPRGLAQEIETTAGFAVPLDGAAGAPVRSGQAVFYQKNSSTPRVVTVAAARAQLRRHRRKYAAGELGEDRSFYFRGPENKLNLRAQNLAMFAQIARGVDDDTWIFHLRRGDYSGWMREGVKDAAVAEEIEAIEQDHSLDAGESRERVIGVIEKHYTAAE